MGLANAARRRLRRRRHATRAHRQFLTSVYRQVLGRDPDRAGLGHYGRMLEQGASELDVVTDLARSDEYVAAATERASYDPDTGALRSDEAFLDALYHLVLARAPDATGRASFLDALARGAARAAVTGQLATSDEHVNRVGAEFFHLTDLRALRPDRYEAVTTVDGDERAVFRAEGPDDFDWLEAAILEHGYYEKPGVWSFGIDLDKRVMAELLAAFAPSRALDVGCASGAVIRCLADLGIDAEGVEISDLAIERAEPEIRARIHQGDLLDLDAEGRYDLVFGLDIFEHLNPNRIDAYLRSLQRLLVPGGFAFAEIPVFGTDPVWGTAMPVSIDAWRLDAERRLPFHAIPVDRDGYPELGHLIWADSDWWVERFAAAGLRREPEIERALHRRYDDYILETYPGRYTFYVLSSHAPDDRVAAVVGRIESTTSSVGARYRP